MLAKNARLYPDDIALIELKPGINYRHQISWREFDDRANKISNALYNIGIRKGDKVVHLMTNSIDWLIAYFGIIRTGAWAVPLNFRFTAKDILYCTQIAEAKAFIFGPEFIERVNEIRTQLVSVQKFIYAGDDVLEWAQNMQDFISTASAKPLNVALNGEDPCGLYFTSGTTVSRNRYCLHTRTWSMPPFWRACITGKPGMTILYCCLPYPYRRQDALVRQPV